jgi:hypothetical protein
MEQIGILRLELCFDPAGAPAFFKLAQQSRQVKSSQPEFLYELTQFQNRLKHARAATYEPKKCTSQPKF